MEISSLEDAIAKFGNYLECSENEYKFVCPICSKKSLSYNSLKGLLHCFSCGYGKGIKIGAVTFTVKTHIDKSIQKKVINFICKNVTLESIHKRFLERQGVYNPERFGIGTITPQLINIIEEEFTIEDLYKSGLASIKESRYVISETIGLTRILIPYKNRHGNVISFKTRVDPYYQFDNSIKYLNPKGASPGHTLYWPESYVKGKPLIISEGELKSIAAVEAGFNSCSAPGIAWSKSVEKELKFINSFYSAEKYIALDSGKGFLNDAPIALAWKRILQIFPDATPVPFNTGQDKMDINKFILLHGEENFYDHLNFCKINKDKIRERILNNDPR